MRRAVLAFAVVYLFVLSSLSHAQTSKPEIVPLAQIHAGMRGVAYTVFQGTKPEPMDVEVLGVLRNANGPKGDIGGRGCIPYRRVFERTHCRSHANFRDARDQRA